jgi:predicted porin
MRFVYLLTAASIAAASPVVAGNLEAPGAALPPMAPATAADFDWSGFRTGLAFGYTTGEARWQNEGTSRTGGFRFGYDREVGPLVLGVAADYDFMSQNFTNPDRGRIAKFEKVWRVGARAGVHYGRHLGYVTGGIAGAESDNHGTGEGEYYGLGYEVFVRPDVTVGVEVVEQEFEDFQIPRFDVETTAASVSLNYRF